ncbi:hypothetical protein WN48_00398, partial [Eufriesea mexicana]
IPISLKVTPNNYVNDDLILHNVTSKFRKRNKYEIYPTDYSWKRRTLCATFNNEKYSTERLFETKEERGKRKTLLDYDEPVFMNDIDDTNSLKPHVRVKRNKLGSDSISSFMYQQNYLKDLANSFPRSTYDSNDEHSYDTDVSFDAKREIKSQEYFIDDKQFDTFSDENDQSKVLSVYPFTIATYSSEDKSDDTNFIKLPSDDSKVNALENENIRFVDQTEHYEIESLPEPSNDNTIVNRQSYEHSEVESSPDPMLAVELVRKKRNDYTKVHNENPSNLVTANTKADLLRIRRKTKNKHHKKKMRLRQKKKHVGKKHDVSNNSLRSIKDVRSKNMDHLRVPHERKVNEAKTEGKLKVGVVNVVAKKNNDNNFRRRSVKSKKSIDTTDFGNNPEPKNFASVLHSRLKTTSKEKNVDGISKFPLVARQSTGGVVDTKSKANEDINSLVSKNEEQEIVEEIEKPITLSQDTKSRTKRNKNTESNHGFLNKEEELKYYKNIREPGSDEDQCDDQDETEIVNEMEVNRAVRSIEEVKELAKKLVTKVGSEKQEKRIKTRAIDDLCSNVSTACDVFRETPKIVQKCDPTNSNFGFVTKIVERKAHPVEMINQNKLKIPTKNLVEKKRSVVRRVSKMPSSTSRTVRKETEPTSDHKWGKWTDWSSCSVTCGKGRQIRWRYCLRDCSTAETEMEEKACQLPACPPGKFLGIF